MLEAIALVREGEIYCGLVKNIKNKDLLSF